MTDEELAQAALDAFVINLGGKMGMRAALAVVTPEIRRRVLEEVSAKMAIEKSPAASLNVFYRALSASRSATPEPTQGVPGVPMEPSACEQCRSVEGRVVTRGGKRAFQCERGWCGHVTFATSALGEVEGKEPASAPTEATQAVTPTCRTCHGTRQVGIDGTWCKDPAKCDAQHIGCPRCAPPSPTCEKCGRSRTTALCNGGHPHPRTPALRGSHDQPSSRTPVLPQWTQGRDQLPDMRLLPNSAARTRVVATSGQEGKEAMSVQCGVTAWVTRDEKKLIHAAADKQNMAVSWFIKEALRRTLRGPWTDEKSMLAEYDEIEIEVPSSQRFAKFALLVPGLMEECERTEECDHCAAFMTVVAPDLVLSIDKFKLSEDGLTVTRTRAGMEYRTEGE